MPDRIVHIIPQQKPDRRRVVIYCRVSTKTDAQLHSLSNQLRFLTDEVYDNPEWEPVNVYIDIKSGANTDGRNDLNRMISDARKHKFDTILIKSCSRFFRNVTEALTILHELQDLGVNIIFDEENLNSNNGETFWLYVTTYMTVAEAQNIGQSESIKWGIPQRVSDGNSSLFDRKCYGYMNDEYGHLAINPEEEPTVQLIFKLYLDGCSIVKIINEFKTRGIPSPTGKPVWCKHAIEVMLTNTKHLGESPVLKTTTGWKEKKTREKCAVITVAENDHDPTLPATCSSVCSRSGSAAATLRATRTALAAKKQNTAQKPCWPQRKNQRPIPEGADHRGSFSVTRV
ncbi:resolvase N-terminal domain protein [Clostridium sp. CAG:138]|nr:resolvase N-terminal domain protein [Clostridium sp. CAG:138]